MALAGFPTLRGLGWHIAERTFRQISVQVRERGIITQPSRHNSSFPYKLGK
jgi:hypothetical protein